MPLIILFIAACWLIAAPLVATQGVHYEHNYSKEQIKAMDRLVARVGSGEPDDAPIHISSDRLVHPKTERERAELIAMVWNLK